jgi:hypothetical protein
VLSPAKPRPERQWHRDRGAMAMVSRGDALMFMCGAKGMRGERRGRPVFIPPRVRVRFRGRRRFVQPMEHGWRKSRWGRRLGHRNLRRRPRVELGILLCLRSDSYAEVGERATQPIKAGIVAANCENHGGRMAPSRIGAARGRGVFPLASWAHAPVTKHP